jgi:hypothetical protein
MLPTCNVILLHVLLQICLTGFFTLRLVSETLLLALGYSCLAGFFPSGADSGTFLFALGSKGRTGFATSGLSLADVLGREELFVLLIQLSA